MIVSRRDLLRSPLAVAAALVALGGGDPELEDLRADRAGLACARRDPEPTAVDACCIAAGH